MSNALHYNFDNAELLATARAVRFFNKPAREAFAADENLVSFMISCAYQELKKPSMAATYGFVLSSYWYPGQADQTLVIRSSVSAGLFS
jgi:hypothetical protein